jgi:hypothetical protein
MQGKVNEIGVQAKLPSREMNLSRESPSKIQKIIVKRINRVLVKFFSHCLFGDFGMFL